MQSLVFQEFSSTVPHQIFFVLLVRKVTQSEQHNSLLASQVLPLNIAFILSQVFLVLGNTGPLLHNVSEQILADLVPHCLYGISLRNFSANLRFPATEAINSHPYGYSSLETTHPMVVTFEFLEN